MADTKYVQGLAELNRKLYELRDKVAESAGRRAAYAGAKVIRDKMRANAPVGKDSASPGELKKSITISTRVNRREGKIIAKVGPGKRRTTVTVKTRTGEVIFNPKNNKVTFVTTKSRVKLDQNRDAPPRSEARWLEFGVKPHPIKAKRGKALDVGNTPVASVHHPGFAPKPFMVPSAEQSFTPAVNAFSSELKSQIEKAAK